MTTQNRTKLLKEILPKVISKLKDRIANPNGPQEFQRGQLELATEISYALNRGDFVNLLIIAGLPPDYARKLESVRKGEVSSDEGNEVT